MFTEVLVTDVVIGEVLTGDFTETEMRIQAAIMDGWLKPVVVSGTEPELPDLDEGEAASIRLVLSMGLEALLLIDERAGRAVAQALGLQVAGTAAVIGLAQQKGLIRSAQAIFAELSTSDFRISPEVIETVLDRCGEF
ncbi:DUF3368 domain-containing protein [Cyanobium sp. HWJ4-Hawea]|uniref:DUF3368 domain-containing protein n=1 Tax=Cyanobium sp. HWJ4-Hawea TaxID=2823713 RepID=UPI0020CD1CD9|nr:DUF3368 domain-containing protein [Cyanobium sp. HWJ4-Hawea]